MLDIKETLDWQVSGNIGSIPLPGRAGNREVSENLWDAIVGVKGRFAFGADRRWFVPYYVDVGTGQSDLTWQGMAGIGYSYKWGDISAAWRYLDHNMKSDRKIETVNLNGPMLAVTFRW